MELTPDSWNSRYVKNETGWDLGAVSTPLKTYFDQLTDKDLKILIPGAGNGYEAEYLFHNGFKNVFIVDWAISPLHQFHHRVPDFPVTHLIHQDFFQQRGQYDLIIEQTFFCALDPNTKITLDASGSESHPERSRRVQRKPAPNGFPNNSGLTMTTRPAYAKQMHDLLKDGGKLVGVLFDDKLNNDKPPYGGNKDEYVPYFTPYFTIRYFDRCYNSVEPRANRELFIHLLKKKTDA